MPEHIDSESPAKAKLRETAEALKTAAAEVKSQEKQSLVVANQELAALYHGDAGVGTKMVGSEDVEVPSLVIVQKTSDLTLPEGEGMKLGYLYRSDTQAQRKELLVNILCFKKVWAENFNKTAEERKHIYYGAFDGGSDIFRMYLRGWSLTGSRKFLSEVKRLQLKHRLPMYSLKVRLSVKEEHGTIKNTGQAYTTFSMVLTPIKDSEGLPLVEEDMGRATWLQGMATNFEAMRQGRDDEPVETTVAPKDRIEPEPAPEREGSSNDIPF